MERLTTEAPEVFAQILDNLDKLSVLSCRLVSVDWKRGTESYVREEVNKVPPVRAFRTRFGDLKTLKNFLNSGSDLVTPNVTFGFNPTFPITDTDLVLFFNKFGKLIKSLRIENSSSGGVTLPPIVITEMEAWISKNVQKKEGLEFATIPVEVHEQFDENGNILGKKGQRETENENFKDNNRKEEEKEFSERNMRVEKIYEEIGERLEDPKPHNGLVNPNFGKGIDLQVESIAKHPDESPVYAVPMKKKLPAIPDVPPSLSPTENDASSPSIATKESVAIQIPPETAEEEEARQNEDIPADDEPEGKTDKSKRFKLSNLIQVKFINDAAARKVLANPDYLPVPYDPAGYTAFADFYPYYLGRHFDSRNRRLHILGTTGSILFFILGLLTLTPVLFLVGILQRCICIWTGHYFFEEGNKALQSPIKNSYYSIMGDCKLSWEVASGQRAF